jgi:hypothetical protein
MADRLAEIMEVRSRAIRHGLWLTRFPAEEKWMAFDKDTHLSRSGFHDHPEQALDEAFNDTKAAL